MDPNETLALLRNTIGALKDFSDLCDEEEYTDTGELWELAESIMELAESLDTWVSSGGFLPNDWSPKPSKSLWERASGQTL